MIVQSADEPTMKSPLADRGFIAGLAVFVPALCLLSLLAAGCSLERQPRATAVSSTNTPRTTRWMPSEMETRRAPDAAMVPDADSAMPMANVGVAAPAGSPAAMAGAGAGSISMVPDAGQQPASTTAGQPAAAEPVDSGAASPPAMTANAGCSRAELRAAADAFLLALSSGDAQSLSLDPNSRYTENGEVRTVGTGLWVSRPKTDYARHFLDEQLCSSLTVAVLKDGANRIVYGARLLYRDTHLLEVETIIVRPNDRYFRPDGIIPTDRDLWIEPVDSSVRMSRAELMSFAERYFGSTVEPALLPPAAPGCMCLQNGAPAGLDCGDTPGTERFQQLRYPVIDETAGVATAIAWTNRVIAMYFFKMQAGTMQNIEAVGGTFAENTGW